MGAGRAARAAHGDRSPGGPGRPRDRDRGHARDADRLEDDPRRLGALRGSVGRPVGPGAPIPYRGTKGVRARDIGARRVQAIAEVLAGRRPVHARAVRHRALLGAPGRSRDALQSHRRPLVSGRVHLVVAVRTQEPVHVRGRRVERGEDLAALDAHVAPRGQLRLAPVAHDAQLVSIGAYEMPAPAGHSARTSFQISSAFWKSKPFMPMRFATSHTGTQSATASPTGSTALRILWMRRSLFMNVPSFSKLAAAGRNTVPIARPVSFMNRSCTTTSGTFSSTFCVRTMSAWLCMMS